jgi:two-component system, sensor histidine kinase and response regulator
MALRRRFARAITSSPKSTNSARWRSGSHECGTPDVTLRRKVLWIVALTLVGLVALGYGLVERIWMGWFVAFEHSELRRRTVQVNEAINAELRTLETLAGDYAGWDDTWEFVQAPDEFPEYVTSNFVDATFIGARLNLVVIVNSDAEVVFAKAFDLANEREIPVPTGIQDPQTSFPHLLVHREDQRGTAGLVVVDELPMLVAVRPILTSERTGPARGTLIMGYKLDGSRREAIEQASGSSVRFEPITAAEETTDDLIARVTADNDVAIETIGPTLIAAFAVRRDLRGQPVLLLRIDGDRNIHRQGRRLANAFLVALVSVGAVFGGAALVLLEFFVVRRISDLSRAIKRIGASGNPGGRLPADSSDEIGTLSLSINQTLDTLQRSQEALAYIGRHARCVIWTGDLRRRTDGSMTLDIRMLDDDAAMRVLPLDLFTGGSYAHAWRRSIHADDADRVRQAPSDAIAADATSYGHVYRIRARGGDVHWFQEEVDIEPAGKETWRLVGVCTDVTSGKLAEGEMQAARDAALDIARIKSDFLANVSHEIRTPMNGILGMTEILDDTELTSEQHECLDMIRTSAQTLLRVINDVLDFSKIEAGRLELDRAPFDLRTTIEESCRLSAVRAQERGLELICDIDPGAPVTLLGDSTRLQQILVNLIANAVKFTPQGEVEVSVRSQPVDDHRVHLDIAVRDTGIGIPAEKQELIFQAFQQADSSTTRRFGGTGLGLAISAELAERMHGRLRVESESGSGSTFHCRVLLEIPGGSAELPSPEVACAGRRALIIEPNASARRSLMHMLQEHEIDVVAHAGPNVPDPGADEEPFDYVIVSASANQRADGLAIAADLRAAGQAGMRIAIAGPATEHVNMVSRAREAGLHAALAKPIRRQDLLAFLTGKPSGTPAPTGRHSAETAPCRILIAEDNPINRQVAARMLDRPDWRLEFVQSGLEAVNRAARGDLDVILMDVEMPELDGLEATARIRSDESVHGTRRIPIIAMTAHNDDDIRRRCVVAGMDGYVLKPIDAQNVSSAIADLLSGAPPKRPQPAATSKRAAPEDEPTVFSRERAIEHLDGDAELLAEIANIFVKETPAQLDALDAAVEQGDHLAAERIAHALVGGAGNFGPTIFGRRAKETERIAAAAQTTPTHTAALRSAFEQLAFALSPLCGPPRNSS